MSNEREPADFEEVVERLFQSETFHIFSASIAMPNAKVKKAFGLALAKDVAFESDVSDEHFQELVFEAMSCPQVYDGLALAISIRLKEDGPMTEPMRLWLMDVVTGKISRPKSKGGPSGLVGSFKRIAAANLVFEAAKMGLKPTRSIASPALSAADAVVAALARAGYHTSYDAVAKSWSTHAASWMRDALD